MNLLLRPLENPNDQSECDYFHNHTLGPGVTYYIVYIMSMKNFDEVNDAGSNQSEGRWIRPTDSTPDTQD